MAVGLITSAIYATGAFTNITAQRDANVRVAGDGASYLSLQPANSSNGEYAVQRNGQLHVSLGGTLGGESSGTGVNQESLTVVRDVFTITNKGAQPFGVWMTDSSEAVTFESGNNRRSLEGKQQAVPLKPGESVTVGLTVDTRQHEGDSVIKSVQIHADSEISGSAVGEVGSVDQRKPTPSSQTGQKSGTGTTTSDSSNDDGENPTKKATDSTTAKQKEAQDYIRRFDEDIVNVINFLKKHPELAAVITGGISVGIATWAHENPKKAEAFALGGVLGEVGMPGGMHEVNQKDSPFYLLGMLGLASTPYVGVLADARDFSQNSVSAVKKQSLGDAGEALLDAIGLVGSLGGYGVGDAPKVASVTSDWVSRFSKSPAVLKTIGTFLSKSASQSQTRVALDIVSDGSASVLLHRGESMDEVIQYAMKDDLKQTANILSKRPPSSGTITNDEYLYIVNKGYDEQLVNSMVRRGLTGNKMTKLIHSGVDLKKAKPLVKEGYSADNIQTIVNKGVDPETAIPLAKQGATPDDIKMLSRKGADVDLAADLAADEMPLEHIKYYAENGNDLEGVKQAKERGYTPKFIKIVYTGKNLGKVAVNADTITTGGNFYTLANNYCNWQRQPDVNEKWKTEGSCQTVQV